MSAVRRKPRLVAALVGGAALCLIAGSAGALTLALLGAIIALVALLRLVVDPHVAKAFRGTSRPVGWSCRNCGAPGWTPGRRCSQCNWQGY